MDDIQKQEVKELALEAIKDYMRSKQYNLSMIPNHEHSGSDTSQIKGENLDIRNGITFKPSQALPASPKAGMMLFYGGVFYVCETAGVWKQITTA